MAEVGSVSLTEALKAYQQKVCDRFVRSLYAFRTNQNAICASLSASKAYVRKASPLSERKKRETFGLRKNIITECGASCDEVFSVHRSKMIFSRGRQHPLSTTSGAHRFSKIAKLSKVARTIKHSNGRTIAQIDHIYDRILIVIHNHEEILFFGNPLLIRK